FNQQFIEGDVIYGISQARAPYVSSLPRGVADTLRAIGRFLICDEYNNRTFGANREDGCNTSQFPRSRQIIEANLTFHETAAYLNPDQKAALQEYYDALAGSKYAPLKAVETKIIEAQRKGNRDLTDLVFRRACKFGLQFVIEQKQNTV